MTHPERVEDLRTMEQRDYDNLLRDYNAVVEKITASEKRASEAERTFADLRNLIAVNLAANAELQRRAEEWEQKHAGLYGLVEAELTRLESERDEARAALPAALELIDELRAYAREQWDYKHGKRWDAETEVVRTALTHTGNADA